MPPSYQTELASALAAVTTAASLCRNVQSAIDDAVLSKDDRSPVTVADFASQAIVCRALEEHFPNDPMIAEEDSAALGQPENAHLLDRIQHEMIKVDIQTEQSEIRTWIDRGNAQSYSDRFWTLDPIDGTKWIFTRTTICHRTRFNCRRKDRSCNIRMSNLAHHAEGNNSTGLLFYAIRGAGAFVLPFDADAEPERIFVSTAATSSAARLCESVESGHSSHDDSAQVSNILGITSDPVRLDSQAKYATVACGEADIYLRLPTRKNYEEKIWDHAAGVLVVEEAGGKVADITGKPLDFTLGHTLADNKGVVATNGLLHDQVIAALQRD